MADQPGPAQIFPGVFDVGFGIQQPRGRTLVAHGRGGLRQDLHQPVIGAVAGLGVVARLAPDHPVQQAFRHVIGLGVFRHQPVHLGRLAGIGRLGFGLAAGTDQRQNRQARQNIAPGQPVERDIWCHVGPFVPGAAPLSPKRASCHLPVIAAWQLIAHGAGICHICWGLQGRFRQI